MLEGTLTLLRMTGSEQSPFALVFNEVIVRSPCGEGGGATKGTTVPGNNELSCF